jgi:hypothetical protein
MRRRNLEGDGGIAIVLEGWVGGEEAWLRRWWGWWGWGLVGDRRMYRERVVLKDSILEDIRCGGVLNVGNGRSVSRRLETGMMA